MGKIIDLHRRPPNTRDRALTFVQMVGSFTLDGEERPGTDLPPYRQEPDDAIETLQMLIRRARAIVKGDAS